MSKLKFTLHCKLSLSLIGLFIISIFSSTLNAQCSLGCTGNTQVSLDMMCEAEVTPAMVLNDQTTSCPAGDFYVIIEDQYGNQIVPLPGTEGPGVPAIVTDAHKNQTLYAKVIDDVSGNSCWGNITVEDKLKPVFSCADPVGPFYCYTLNAFTPAVTDNCTTVDDLVMNLLYDLIYANDCSTDFVDELEDCGFFPDANGTTYADALADVGLVAYVLKIHTRAYTATDECGNVSDPCEMKLVVESIPDLTDITCPPSLITANDTHLMCDAGYPLTAEGHPAPRGTFRSLMTIEGEMTLTDDMNAAGTTIRDDYMLEYVSSNGSCQTVTISDNGAPGQIRVFDANGVLIGAAGDNLMVSLCDGQRYTVRKAVGVANPAVPFDYTLTITAPGQTGNFVPDVPYYTDGDVMINLFPDPNIYCNLLTSFSDVNLGNIGCVEKIMRTWTILEWSCATVQRSTTCTQIIEIADDEGPSFTCPADINISTNSTGYNNCGAIYTPPIPTLVDNCCDAADLTLDVSWSQGGIPLGAVTDYAGSPINLPTGDILVTYTAYDCCYNSSSCSYTVTVEDNTPPVAVCDQFTVVSLSTDGTAHVYASVFDDGSYDDCHLAGMRVKRMDDGANCGIVADEFDEFITLCCNDIGTNVMIQFRVYDNYNADGTLNLDRFNECMVEVEVQDKLAPIVTCPADITLDCEDPFDFNGDLVAQFGDYTVVDNCGFTVTDVITGDLDQCNLGFVTRTITVTDDGGRTSTCTQRINVINNDPFYVNPNNICDATDDDVQWAADVELEGCDDPNSSAFHPDVTGFPLISEDQCDLVGVNWVDQVFPFNVGPNGQEQFCFKILRTWTILDWCQMNHPNNQDSDPTNDIAFQWSCTQVIKVNDPIGPTITSDCSDKSTCTYDQTCSDGFIELTATATDDCTLVLDWWADIDAFSNGSFDITLSGTGGLADASGDYPVGTHIIYWSFKDKCGNVATCSQEFTILNCKAPTAYCLNGLATDLMPVDTDGDGQADNGMIEIWANDFDNGSHHVCGYDVVLSFSSDITNTAMTFTCSNVGNNSVSVYVTAVDASGAPLTLPDGTLLQSFCNTFIDIQDNMMVCPIGGLSSRISGNVATEDDKDLEGTEIHLGDGVNIEMTNDDGMYAFQDMPNGGVYDIDPVNDLDHMNGVSTLDLVLIQKHILSIDNLDSPYKMIAADINMDDNISAIDLIELRKLILGIYLEYPNNESWRFIDESYTFVDASDPLEEAFPETYAIPNLNSDMDINFVAVKVGDVNNSVETSLQGNTAENRTNASLELYIDDVDFEIGQTISIPFKAAEENSIVGYQFTLDYDVDAFEFAGVASASLNVTEQNFGQQHAEKGQLTSSWHQTDAVNIQENDVLFTLEFIAKQNGTSNNMFAITSDITNAEAYTPNIEVMDVTLNTRTEVLDYVLHQNTPNPFNETTNIAFEIPFKQNVKISIFDVTGKTVHQIRKDFEAGYNQVIISQDVLNTSGILYYSLEANGFTATKKMVVLK